MRRQTKLRNRLRPTKIGYQIDFCRVGETPPSGQDAISVLDLDHPFLYSANEAEFQWFVEIVDYVKGFGDESFGILWVTGACQFNCRDPRYALIMGVSRVCHTERQMDIGTFELESFNDKALETVPEVCHEFNQRSHEPYMSPNVEWASENETVMVGRCHFIDVVEGIKTTNQQAIST
jgi:hypothetical protein